MPAPTPPSRLAPSSPEKALSAVQNARFLDNKHQMEIESEAWSSATVIGLDTEFVRERTFRARPGLVQLSEGENVWLLDAVRLDAAPPLASVLRTSGIIKVLHSVGEDLEVLLAVAGVLPEPLFDTQIAAAMLGMPLQCRYESLVEEIFGVHLPGGKARNDWCRRPLAEDLLEYAAQDVIWLPRLQQHLAEQLDAAGRLAWLEEDCRRIVRNAHEGDRTPPLARVKGAARLDDEVLALLESLADWREDQAIRRDLPRRFVIADQDLINLASAAVRDQPKSGVDRLGKGLRKRHGEELLALMQSHDPAGFERPASLCTPDREQRERISLAQGVVREIAAELDVDPALLASKKALTRLVCGERPEWLDGWRGRLLIERLEAASVSIRASSSPGSSAG